MYKKVEGIVVSEYPFEDSSKIIKIFTKDGIISAIARGAKKIKSPLFGVTSVFTFGIFNIAYKEEGLSRVTDVDLFNDFRNIRKSIEKISYATYITELATKVYKHESNSDIYNLYIECLNKIAEGYDPAVLADILRLKLLNYLGIMPVIDRCVICGDTKEIITISSYYGGFVCKNCLRNERIVSPKVISLIRMFYYVDIGKIKKIDVSMDAKKEINDFINDYYDRYSGIYLKSRLFTCEKR